MIANRLNEFFMALRTRTWITFLVLCGLVTATAVWYARSPRPHNVLLITLDTTRADRLGCYGYAFAQTPTLDRLAQEGVLFERAYAPVPLTLPSHASMLTGLYPPEHGLHINGQAALPEGIPTLATQLQAAGYETGAFVAAFVLNQKFGLQRGFDAYDDDLSLADPSLHGHHQYRDGSLVVDAALRWLRPRSHKPFFCWVHLFDPHYPYLAHEDRYGAEYNDRPYDAEIAYVDEQIDRLVGSLRQSGALENTIIVVAGDHGESLGEHGELAHGMTLYDATLRVPLLIVSPQEGRPGHRVAEPVSLADLAPTLLDRLALAPLPDVSGRSLRSAMRGEPLTAQPCYAETNDPYDHARWSPLRALIAQRWKYIRSPKVELYDLVEDPKELTNLAARSPEQVRQMEDELAAWEARMNRRLADNVALSEEDRRALSGLGYASPRMSVAEPSRERPLRDVKDMLPYYYKFNDAAAMIDAGRYDLAEPLLREVLAADDEYFMAHGELARCLLRLNRIAEAIVHLRHCVELDPGAQRVQGMLGAALLLDKQYSAAVDVLETALRLDETSYEAHFNLGLALEKLSRPDEAREHYAACVELNPDFAPARVRFEQLSEGQ